MEPSDRAPSAASFVGSAAGLRRMIAGHERAAEASLRAASPVLPPEEAFDAGMDLWAHCPELFGAPADPVRLRGEEQARAVWKRLKARFAK